MRSTWNREFRDGTWDFLEQTSDDHVYRYIIKYCRQGTILDLGCGSGNTGTELPLDSYAEYTGIDISDVAVEKAKERSNLNSRATKNQYLQGDILSFVPPRLYDVVLLRESIWYIPRAKLQSVLHRYAQFLKPDGVFVVRIYERNKFSDIVTLIQTHYHVIEAKMPPDSNDIIIVFCHRSPLV